MPWILIFTWSCRPGGKSHPTSPQNVLPPTLTSFPQSLVIWHPLYISLIYSFVCFSSLKYKTHKGKNLCLFWSLLLPWCLEQCLVHIRYFDVCWLTKWMNKVAEPHRVVRPARGRAEIHTQDCDSFGVNPFNLCTMTILFIQQMFIEILIPVGHCSRCWGESSEQNRQNRCP